MRILFFAQLKDATRCDSVDLEVTTSLDTEHLWTELLKKFPNLAAHRASVRLAKNLEYTRADVTFGDTDEVALIPPVSGG